MRIISAPQQAPMSDISAFIELAKDPKGFEAKLKQLKDSEEASNKAAEASLAAAEQARQEQAKAAAVIDEANAIMAGAKRGQADLGRDRETLAIAKRDFEQIVKATRDDLGKRTASLEEREKSAERREIALRAREGNLEKAEAAVSALRDELEAKLANLRKMVA